MKILVHCWAQKMRENAKSPVNPKNYPYWKELIEILQQNGHTITQLGLDYEVKLVEDFRTLNYQQLKEILKEYDTWIAIDSFLPHLAWIQKVPGIVLFGPSNPSIFGHTQNINLYKNKKHFRPDQFGIWEECDYNKNAFVKPDEVIKALKKLKPA